MRQIIGHLLILILIAIIVFVVSRFVGNRNEFGYIGPDKESIGYQYLMSGLDSWDQYISGNIQLSQTQQYFKRAIDNNRDTALGNILSRNIAKVHEQQELNTIQYCVTTVRSIGGLWDEIDTSYDELLKLLSDQLQLIPTVLSSVKNITTAKCVQTYLDHVKTTSITLAQSYQQRGVHKSQYADDINEYPRILGACDRIMEIEQQSRAFKQEIADLTYQYYEYKRLMDDPLMHAQFCQENYAVARPTLHLPSFKSVGSDIQGAINTIKSGMK